MAISISRVSISSAAIAVFILSALLPGAIADEASPATEEPSAVLTLDASNFDEIVSKHPFIVVEFYAPWCGHCKKLEPEYEKAAAILSKHDPPVVLAKVDANEKENKELAAKYDVTGFPTIKILKKGAVLEYKGPREADGIVEYLKKQVGPPSVQVETPEEFNSFFDKKKVSIVGIFQEFTGEEYENYIAVADKLRSDYDFAHTTSAKILPLGDSTVKQPTVRLFKPFDELFVDFQDFKVDALESFIESTSLPTVATFDNDPDNRPFLIKFFNSPNSKAMLFLNFSSEEFNSYKSKLHEVAEKYKGNKISFLIGDLDASQGAFQYFGLRDDQVPLIIIQESDSKKYLQPNVKSDGIGTWVKDYLDGNVKPYRKSEPIPEVNNEPVKTVVADNLKEVVFDSGKNVLLEFYAPWCGHCKKLAPILEEVAISLQNDNDVVIAKMDATANDVPEEFAVHGYPTLYFSSASGKLLQYDGDRSAGDIINYVNKNKDSKSQPDVAELVKDDSDESVKDEL